MKMSDADINLVASMLTDDPDLIVNEDKALNEWGARPLGSGGGGPSGAPPLGSAPPSPKPGAGGKPDLARAFKVTNPRQLADLKQEYDSFVRYQPSLSSKGPEAALQAFIQYKKSGRMPAERDSAELDQGNHGYGDFR